MNAKPKTFKGKAKVRVQRAARKILGVGTFPALCERAAKHFGETWDGKKGSGYDYLLRIVGLQPTDPQPEKRQRVPRPKKAATGFAPRTRMYGVDPRSDEFLLSYEWRAVRMKVLAKFGARCQCCGATPKDGVRMHVDHIKPRKFFPELALEITNLQVLCEVCNHGKGNWDETDWRPSEATSAPEPPASYEPFWSAKNH